MGFAATSHDAAAGLARALQAAIAPLESVDEAVVVVHASTLGVLALNRAARELVGDLPADATVDLGWLFPDLDAAELAGRVRSLVGSGGRSMGLTVRPRWRPEGAARAAVRLDLVRRDGVPLLVAFVRDSPEDQPVLPSVVRDPRDDLPGRAAVLRILDGEVRRAFRHGRALSVVSIRLLGVDSDHALGDGLTDGIMALAGRELRTAVRVEESIGRVGPDEFLWVLPDTEADGARHAAERARAIIAGDDLSSLGLPGIAVGVAALVRGDTAATLMRRAHQDSVADPGPGQRTSRDEILLSNDSDRLLRAALAGDARSVTEITADAFDQLGPLAFHDSFIQPALARLSRNGAPESVRPAEDHRALALIRWSIARRPREHPRPGSPVIVLSALGVEPARATLPAASDAASMAGWVVIEIGLSPSSDPHGPILALGASAFGMVLGDDSDLLEAERTLLGMREDAPNVKLFAVSAPDGVLRRWAPPSGVQAASSANELFTLLLEATPPTTRSR